MKIKLWQNQKKKKQFQTRIIHLSNNHLVLYTFILCQKWNQKQFDEYFPIIYANHLAALSLTLVYIPYLFASFLAWLHGFSFLCLVVVNIVLNDSPTSNYSKSSFSRVIWIGISFLILVMCSCNLLLIINGLTGVPKVLF